MQINEIITALNQEISRLEQVRNLLANETRAEQTGKRRGRPKGSVNKPRTSSEETIQPAPKRQMSEAGRARIAAAQKKRWAVAKQADKSEPTTSSKKAPAGRRTGKVGRPSKKSVRQRQVAQEALTGVEPSA